MRVDSFTVTICFLALLSTACSNRTPIVQQVTAVDQARCRFLGIITGSSLVGGDSSLVGLGNAQTEALMQARLIKATHVIWVETESKPNGSRVAGQVYECL